MSPKHEDLIRGSKKKPDQHLINKPNYEQCTKKRQTEDRRRRREALLTKIKHYQTQMIDILKVNDTKIRCRLNFLKIEHQTNSETW